MAYFVDVPDVEILPDLQEDEAARMLLLLAHDEGTIDDEELLLLNFALDEDLKETSSKAAIKPGEKFDLDTESEGSCISMFRFTKEEIRRLCVCCYNFLAQQCRSTMFRGPQRKACA